MIFRFQLTFLFGTLLGCVTVLYFQFLPVVQDSSVWCSKDNRENNMCSFKNVFYNKSTDLFGFLLGDNSIIRGVPNIASLQSIRLSSVLNHNGFYFNIGMLMNRSNSITCEYSVSNAILMSRFKPDNIMHLIHDDLLPLFTTLERLCHGDTDHCFSDTKIIFYDPHSRSHFWYMYQLINNEPILLREMNYNLICFDTLYVGLDVEATWYQYGFGEPRGALHLMNYNFDILSKFKMYILKKLQIRQPDGQSHAVILARNQSRKILNPSFLRDALKNETGRDPLVLDVAPENMKNIIGAISNSDLIIGIHGAELILTIFALPSAKVIELLPFGIAMPAVSFLHSLSGLANCPFQHFSWSNQHRNGSICHPEAHPLQGGISHFSAVDRQRIVIIDRIEKVQCCDDPAFLYLMYQDTFVASDFLLTLKRALSAPLKSSLGLKQWFYPAKVQSALCTITKTGLSLRWGTPENVESGKVEYHITVDLDGQVKSFIIQNENILKVRGQIKKAVVWISVKFVGLSSSSPDLFADCLADF